MNLCRHHRNVPSFFSRELVLIVGVLKNCSLSMISATLIWHGDVSRTYWSCWQLLAWLQLKWLLAKRAARRRSFRISRSLRRKFPRMKTRDLSLQASLSRKLFKADPRTVERSLRRGADPWQRDPAGNVPLHVASEKVVAWNAWNHHRSSQRKFVEM